MTLFLFFRFPTWRSPTRSDVRLVLPLLIAFGLRLAWAIAQTVPSLAASDPNEYVSYARQLAELDGYRLNGRLSAFYSAGYPLLLSPFAWLDRHTGWVSVLFSASLLNVVLGTLVVHQTGRLATTWFGDNAGSAARWLMAVCPGAIVMSSVAITEPLFTAVLLAVTVAASDRLRAVWIGDDRPPLAAWELVGLGALIGYLMIVRTQGVVALVVVLLAVRAAGGSWRRVGVVAGWILLGSLVFLVPATVRNGLQVGHWSPASTNNAAALCQGHSPGANGTFVDDPDFIRRCYGSGNPYGEGRSEAEWYRTTTAAAIGYAFDHPAEEMRLIAVKAYRTLGPDRASGELSFARLGDGLADGLWTAIEWWRVIVVVLAVVALARVPACRRAVLVWSPPLLVLTTVVLSVGAGRLGAPIMPFLAALAAVLLAPDDDAGSTGAIALRDPAIHRRRPSR